MRRLPAVVLALVLLACSRTLDPQRAVQFTPTPAPFAPVDVGAVRIYEGVSESSYPTRPVRIAYARVPRKQADNGAVFLSLRDGAARRGANAVLRVRTEAGVEYVAVRFDSLGFVEAERLASIMRGGAPSLGNGVTSATEAGSAPGGDVYVRGYCRKDGVCVRPHTRSRPGGGRRKP